MNSDSSNATPLVPISALFHSDAGPHVVHRGTRGTRSAAASGDDLASLLGAGIAGLSGMAPPADQAEEELVPVESLLFRGRTALAQAIAVSDRLATRGLTPDRDGFAEIRDLLHLATTE